jgi:hypothetical protein
MMAVPIQNGAVEGAIVDEEMIVDAIGDGKHHVFRAAPRTDKMEQKALFKLEVPVGKNTGMCALL